MVATGTLRLIEGFETGGFETAQATVGSPSILGSIVSPAGRSGAFALRLNPASTQEIYSTWSFFGASGVPVEAGLFGHSLYGFAVRFSDLSPGTEFAFASFYDEQGTPAVVASLVLETGGNLRFDDASGSEVLTVTTPFTVNEWLYIEVAFRVWATGAYELWVEGVSQGSGTGDFEVATSSPAYCDFGGAGSGDGNVDIDDFYIVNHTSTLQGNNLGPTEVLAYQQDQANSTSGSGLTTNDDNASASWSAVGQTPLSEGGVLTWDAGTVDDGAIIYDEGASGVGHPGGPSTGAPYDVSGTIQGAQFMEWGKRGSGSGSSQEMYYGNSGTTPLTASPDWALGTVYVLRGIVTESADLVPTSSEDFAMGGGGGATDPGGRDHQQAELWAMLLHTPASAPSVNITGVVATADAAGIAGAVVSIGIVGITGVIAEADAAGVVGTVASHIDTAVTGVIASADAAGVAGSVTSIGIVAVTGVIASADAAGIAGTVASHVDASITGVIASADAAGIAGAVASHVDATVTGVVATADAAGVAGSVVSIGIVSITGVIATADAAGVAGTVESHVDTAVSGVIATADAAGIAGTVESKITTTITGVIATADAAGIPGAVSTGTNVTVTGVIATADAAGVAGTVASIGIVNVTGVVASADAAGVPGAVIIGASGFLPRLSLLGVG